LVNVDAIEGGADTAIGDLDFGADLRSDPLGSGRTGTGDRQVVHLSATKDLETVDGGSVEATLVGGSGKTDSKKDDWRLETRGLGNAVSMWDPNSLVTRDG
jgi:hypothetical protein